MHESSGQPGIVQDCSDPTPPPFGNFDINCQNGNPAMGLMQIIPGTWASTTVGNAYPFDAYWDNPIVSVAVRAQNQMNYGIFPTIAGGQ
jgi:SLT domain-containing protein